MFMAVALFIACCGAAPASNGNNTNNTNSNNGRPTQARVTALDIAAARKNHYIDPFTVREVASDSMFRKVIAERMKNKIKPPKFHKPPRSPNKPDEDEGDHDHGPGNDDHDHGPHDDHDNGNHNGQGNTNGNSGQGNDKDKKDDKKESRTPERRFR
jgi:hypothetical protein